MKRLVLIGGGHTHALVLNALRSAPLRDVAVSVINPGKTAPYSGMLPGFVAGHYDRGQLDIDLQQLCSWVGATLIEGKACAMHPSARSITLEGGQELAFDVASFDVGITSRMERLDGFERHATPAKPLGPFADRWNAFLSNALTPRIAVIGGGVAGSELAMAMAHGCHAAGKVAQISLLDRGTLLSALSPTARRKTYAALKRRNVTLRDHVAIASVQKGGVVLESTEVIRADFIVGAAGATPHPWIAQTGLDLHQGYIKVDPFLQSSVRNVFAVGDCAHMVDAPRPKAGVYAVRQAPVLLANLRAAFTEGTPTRFRPQSDYLKLVSLGGKQAMGEKFGVVFTGGWVWRLKDRIDRQFMHQFRQS